AKGEGQKANAFIFPFAFYLLPFAFLENALPHGRASDPPSIIDSQSSRPRVIQGETRPGRR
ncbi:MAG TPA: hypothetical protein VG148_03275, partial [Pyrinomonadaceae bacterium]|nr:hypothetical protein [Pyrinomonadaceae bacterium]